MNRVDDRRSHAQALWGLRVKNQTKRIVFSGQLLLASTALGAFLVPMQTLDKAEITQAFNYGRANTLAWFASDTAARPTITVQRYGQALPFPLKSF